MTFANRLKATEDLPVLSRRSRDKFGSSAAARSVSLRVGLTMKANYRNERDHRGRIPFSAAVSTLR
jgi:hypothetical protein